MIAPGGPNNCSWGCYNPEQAQGQASGHWCECTNTVGNNCTNPHPNPCTWVCGTTTTPATAICYDNNCDGTITATVSIQVPSTCDYTWIVTDSNGVVIVTTTTTSITCGVPLGCPYVKIFTGLCTGMYMVEVQITNCTPCINSSSNIALSSFC